MSTVIWKVREFDIRQIHLWEMHAASVRVVVHDAGVVTEV
jgi:hypothetical protein